MADYLIDEDLQFFLKKNEYLYVATSNADGTPNVAPKFLIKAERDCIYLADFVIGRTHANLQSRSKASLSVINLDELTGYQINGTAELIGSGAEFDEIVQVLDKREIQFSAKRLIEGVRQEKKSKNYELTFPERLIVIKVAVQEIVRISHGGKVEREKKSSV
jgi:predicted pyridoxine 5'-phosphate oxidase superfamily flavin-nucleotide-binding protein